VTEGIQESAPPDEDNLSATVVIVNDLGLHARPAAEFVKIANSFKHCRIMIRNDEFEINGKSIMGLLMLAAGKGTELTIDVTGAEAQDMLDEIVALIESGFGEEISD
jgi:phosphocarrier protein